MIKIDGREFDGFCVGDLCVVDFVDDKNHEIEKLRNEIDEFLALLSTTTSGSSTEAHIPPAVEGK